MSGRACIDCGASVSYGSSGRCQECAKPVRANSLRREMPSDFATVAATLKINEIKKHYKTGYSTVTRWLKLSGLKRQLPQAERVVKVKLGRPPANIRPMPAGFALAAPSLTRKELRERYGAGDPVIGRWLAEAGVEPRRSNYVWNRQSHRNPRKPIADVSREGQAADYLRKWSQVYRCNERGGPDPKGTHWRRGNAVLTGDELIERAIYKGWDEHVWQRVA